MRIYSKQLEIVLISYFRAGTEKIKSYLAKNTVTVASEERSFSKLKLIRKFLRSTMDDDRLSSLAILSIENDIVENPDWTTSVNEFAGIKTRKVSLKLFRPYKLTFVS